MNFPRYPKLLKLYPLKRAIITGAGSGLGLELTKLLLTDGWIVCALDIKTDALKQIQHSNLLMHEADVVNRVVLKKVIEDFCSEQHGIDIVFNNAGVGEGSLFKDYTSENWDWIISINLKAVIDTTYVVLPFLLRQNSGTIVNMASMAGIANLPRMSPYNVTKAAVISLSETLNHELYKTDIHVVCVEPTFFQSSIMQYSKGDERIIASAEKTVDGSALTSKDAADILLRNLHKRKEVLRFPFSSHVFFYSRRLFPYLYKKVIRNFLMK